MAGGPGAPKGVAPPQPQHNPLRNFDRSRGFASRYVAFKSQSPVLPDYYSWFADELRLELSALGPERGEDIVKLKGFLNEKRGDLIKALEQWEVGLVEPDIERKLRIPAHFTIQPGYESKYYTTLLARVEEARGVLLEDGMRRAYLQIYHSETRPRCVALGRFHQADFGYPFFTETIYAQVADQVEYEIRNRRNSQDIAVALISGRMPLVKNPSAMPGHFDGPGLRPGERCMMIAAGAFSPGHMIPQRSRDANLPPLSHLQHPGPEVRLPPIESMGTFDPRMGTFEPRMGMIPPVLAAPMLEPRAAVHPFQFLAMQGLGFAPPTRNSGVKGSLPPPPQANGPVHVPAAGSGEPAPGPAPPAGCSNARPLSPEVFDVAHILSKMPGTQPPAGTASVEGDAMVMD